MSLSALVQINPRITYSHCGSGSGDTSGRVFYGLGFLGLTVNCGGARRRERGLGAEDEGRYRLT